MSSAVQQGDNQASDTVEGSNKRRLEEYSFFDWFEDSSLPAGSDYQNDPVCVAILELWKRPEQYYLTVCGGQGLAGKRADWDGGCEDPLVEVELPTCQILWCCRGKTRKTKWIARSQ